MRATFVFTLELLAYGLVTFGLWGLSQTLGLFGAGISLWVIAQGVDK
jgi:hypothetical protein